MTRYLILALLLSGCATTDVRDKWKHQCYSGQISLSEYHDLLKAADDAEKVEALAKLDKE